MTEFNLPISASRVIPHRPPILFVKQLVGYDEQEGSGVVEAHVRHDALDFSGDRSLINLVLVEMMAQAYATLRGYENLLKGKPVQRGYLVGIRKAGFLRRPDPGDELAVRVRTVKALGDFFVAEGSVAKGDLLMARSTLKVWSPP